MPASIELWAYGAMTGELLTMPRVVLQSTSCELPLPIAASGHQHWDGLTVPLLARATNPHSRWPEMRQAKGFRSKGSGGNVNWESWYVRCSLRWVSSRWDPNVRRADADVTPVVRCSAVLEYRLFTTNPSQPSPGVSDPISLLAHTPHFTEAVLH